MARKGKGKEERNGTESLCYLHQRREGGSAEARRSPFPQPPAANTKPAGTLNHEPALTTAPSSPGAGLPRRRRSRCPCRAQPRGAAAARRGPGTPGPSSGAGAGTRLPLPKMATPLAVNSGKNNLSVGLRLLLRLSPRPSRSAAALRLSPEPAEPGRPPWAGRAWRGGEARPGGQRGRAAGRQAGAGRGVRAGAGERPPVRRCPGSGRAELPGDGAPRSELPPCLAGPGGESRQAAKAPLAYRELCNSMCAWLRYYTHLLMLCGVRGKREIYPESCPAFCM